MGKKASKGIQNAMDGLHKRYGEHVIQKMDEVKPTEVISTGRPKLNIAMGCGGWAVGKIHEIYAESGCGKTGLGLEAVKVVQDMGGTAAVVDMEHALNTEYCNQIGVDIESLYIATPNTGEMAFETIRALIKTGEVDLILVDSVSAMVPKAELEGESGQAHMAVQARMMSQGMKLITGPASDAGCTIIFINQLRKTLAMYGPSDTTTGGKALKFYATQRLEIKNKGMIRESEQVIGFKQLIKVVKNKVAPPYKEVLEDIVYGKGVDGIAGLIEALVFEGIVDKAGAWFKYKGSNIAQGLKKLRVVLDDNPELLEELKQKLEEITAK